MEYLEKLISRSSGVSSGFPSSMKTRSFRNMPARRDHDQYLLLGRFVKLQDPELVNNTNQEKGYMAVLRAAGYSDKSDGFVRSTS
jgi:hypothetical protein